MTQRSACPPRSWVVLLLALVACSGNIEGPASLDTCTSCPGGKQREDGAPSQGDTPGQVDVARPSAGDPKTPDGVGWSTRFAKLSNQQWENTIVDLLALDAPTGLAKDFTQEPLDKPYDSLAAAELTIGGDAWSRYQSAAEQVAQRIVTNDALLTKLAPQGTFADASARGAAFIASFGRRVYRRPLTKDEQSAYVSLFARGPTLVSGDAYKAGVQLVVEAMLQSVHFLYRVESSSEARADRKIALSGYELATRLAYVFWNSTPSDALLSAAAAGELDTAAGVARWAEKALDDARAKSVLLSFHEQTFQTAAYGTQEKDPALGFDAATLAPLLKEEARRFFEHVLFDERGGIAELLTDPTAFVNATTAPLYGLSGVSGSAFAPQQLSDRAGLLMQLGFLTKNATRTSSDPVHRGLLVLRKILCDEPDPPPMMFSLPTPMAGLTTREVYERATECGGSCHKELINPPGFAFEGFDALGRVRTMEAQKPIDARGTLAIREGFTREEKRNNPQQDLSFDGARDMVQKLAVLPRVHECYARNWMQYALARELDPSERGASELLGKSSREDGDARALLVRLVQLDTFRFRVSDAL